MKSLRMTSDATTLFGTAGFVYKATLETPSVGVIDPEAGTSIQLTSQDVTKPQYITHARPTLHGTAYPNSTVTVTIHSDPIVCITVADAEGNWSCTIPSDIPAGTHTVTVQLVNPDTDETEEVGGYYIYVEPDQVITNETVGVPNTGIVKGQPELAIAIGGVGAGLAVRRTLRRFLV